MVTWNGCGVPSPRRAIVSPSRTISRTSSARTASTTSGTATLTSRRLREYTRTSSPALCTWIRAPSSLNSTDARPRSRIAAPTPSAESASIGWIGVNGRTTSAVSAASPSTSAARATGASAPASIAARRTVAGRMFDARATASTSTPSSAPCRSSPNSSRARKSCSCVGRPFEQAPQRFGARPRRPGSRERRDPDEDVVDIRERERGVRAPAARCALRRSRLRRRRSAPAAASRSGTQ